MPWRLVPFELGLGTILGIVAAQVMGFLGLVAAAANQMPEWTKYLLGPFGGLVGTLVAVWWLAKRLNRVEQQAAAQRQRDSEALLEILRTQTEVATKCHAAIEANTRLLERIQRGS